MNATSLGLPAPKLVGMAVEKAIDHATGPPSSKSGGAKSTEGKPDPDLQQVWRDTMFVRGRLDESLRNERGYETALQESGMALGSFAVKPIGIRVRQFSIPQYARVEVPRPKNELNEIRSELLSLHLDPNSSTCNSLGEYLCRFSSPARTKV